MCKTHAVPSVSNYISISSNVNSKQMLYASINDVKDVHLSLDEEAISHVEYAATKLGVHLEEVSSKSFLSACRILYELI